MTRITELLSAFGAHYRMEVGGWRVEETSQPWTISNIRHRHQATMLADYLYAMGMQVKIVPPAAKGSSWTVTATKR